MKPISERQRRLLAQAIASPLGAIALGDRANAAGAGNSLAALVRHGLMVVIDDDGVRSLSITQAGIEAMAIKATPHRVRRKVKRASREHDLIAGLEPPCTEEEQIDAAVPIGPRGRTGVMFRLFSRPNGASVSEVVAATGWLPHSIRAQIATSLRAGWGYQVEHVKGPDGGSYKIVAGAQAGEAPSRRQPP